MSRPVVSGQWSVVSRKGGRSIARGALLLLGALLLAGCMTAGTAAPLPPAPTVTPVPTPVSATMPWLRPPPEPISLPADEAPHDVLTEWWYYTGHLDAVDGGSYGFEFVVFQVGIGEGVPTYISHFAITDITAGTFQYDQRRQFGEQPRPSGGGFALALGDWSMSGREGADRLRAALPGYAMDVALQAQKPPALHMGKGYISFGAAGDSYYYSRTRMAVSGIIEVNGARQEVTGTAWFDHQWGDFINVKGGGWDWFSFQLNDDTDIMVFVVRDPLGAAVIRYGSVVDAAGATTDLTPDEVSIEATGAWTSPRTGGVYPSGWRIQLPTQATDLTVTPVLLDQELDTRPTTGVIYWEGTVEVTGTRAGQPVAGRGYVELTGYAE